MAKTAAEVLAELLAWRARPPRAKLTIRLCIDEAVVLETFEFDDAAEGARIYDALVATPDLPTR